MSKLKGLIKTTVENAKEASVFLRQLGASEKNKVLSEVVRQIKKQKAMLKRENSRDLRAAKSRNLSGPLIDRLRLDERSLRAISASMEDIIRLEDKTGELINLRRRPNGLLVGQKRVPIGVIGIIYESRPNVTTDAAALCLKSGNAVILKGGSESIHSNRALFSIFRDALRKYGIPEGAVSFIDTTDREAVRLLLKEDACVDLIIPRGGPGLVREVVRRSRIPVIKHDKGLCHIYVDADANLGMAREICLNAKVQKPAVCNAVETILIHKDVALEFIPKLFKVYRRHHVEIRGCPKTREIDRSVKSAGESDWHAEYLELIVSVRVVDSFGEALAHIEKYGSMHSEAIVTENYRSALAFVEAVDASCVFVNASTRFADGYEFGLGAEMGISTNKLHARGPMGLESLSTFRYVAFGQGQIRK